MANLWAVSLGYLWQLGLLIPIGALGVFRWAMWLAKRIPALFYRPIENDYDCSATIVTPVYNEDPVLFRRAIESWIANRPDRIIAVIDVTFKEDPKAKLVLINPEIIHKEGKQAGNEGCLRPLILHIERSCHHLIIPHPCPDPFQGLQHQRISHKRFSRISRINKMCAPGIHMDLEALPGNIHHATPHTVLTIIVANLSEALHRGKIIVMIP